MPNQLLDPDPSGYPGLFASFLDNTALWLYRGGPDPGAKGGFDHIPEATLSCSVMFVSVGQWALSAQTSGKPYSAGRFRREMEQVAARLKAYNVKVGRPVAVLHSLNYSPLGYSRLQCPAADWRTPDRIEAFNAVLQQVALKASLHFVDTTDVIGPIWDSGKCSLSPDRRVCMMCLHVPACAVIPPPHTHTHARTPTHPHPPTHPPTHTHTYTHCLHLHVRCLRVSALGGFAAPPCLLYLHRTGL